MILNDLAYHIALERANTLMDSPEGSEDYLKLMCLVDAIEAYESEQEHWIEEAK